MQINPTPPPPVATLPTNAVQNLAVANTAVQTVGTQTVPAPIPPENADKGSLRTNGRDSAREAGRDSLARETLGGRGRLVNIRV